MNLYLARFSGIQLFLQFFDENRLIQCPGKSKLILSFEIAFPHIRRIQDSSKVYHPSSFALWIFPHFQKIGAPYHLIYRPYTKLRHIFPEFPGNKPHEMNHIFWFSFETFPKFWILCCHSHRTGVLIADPHHHTAKGYQRSRRKSKFLCSQKSCDGYVPAAHQLSVRLYPNFVSQSVFQKCLMRLGKAQLPRESGIVNGTSRCGSGASVVPGDQDHLSSCLCHTSRNRTYPGL